MLAFLGGLAWLLQVFVMRAFDVDLAVVAANVDAHSPEMFHALSVALGGLVLGELALQELEVSALVSEVVVGAAKKRVFFLVEEAEIGVEEVVAMKLQMVDAVQLASQSVSLSSLLVRSSCACRLLLEEMVLSTSSFSTREDLSPPTCNCEDQP